MLSIIVPVFNGELHLKALFERLLKVTGKLDEDVELIFIDDGSSDGSLDLLRQICTGPQTERVCCGYISFERNYGQQIAVLCGLRHSRGESVATIDDDLQHPPEVIPLMLERLETANGDVGAVYAVPEKSARRRAGGRMRDLFFTVFMGKPAGLRIGSYRVLSRRAADSVCEAVQPFVYISAEMFRRGFSAVSVEYGSRQSEGGPKPPDNTGSGRYSTAARIRLYMNLFRWYGPFGSRKAGVQYLIAEKGGCL